MCRTLLLTGRLPTACITGELAGNSEPVITKRMLRSHSRYSKREDIGMTGLADGTAISRRIGSWAGIPDDIVQDRQEAKDSAAPKENLPPGALPCSSALFRPSPGTGPRTFQ